jgi:hypothetical protein
MLKYESNRIGKSAVSELVWNAGQYEARAWTELVAACTQSARFRIAHSEVRPIKEMLP